MTSTNRHAKAGAHTYMNTQRKSNKEITHMLKLDNVV